MKHPFAVFTLIFSFSTLGCDKEPVAILDGPEFRRDAVTSGTPGPIEVLNQNLYVGADVDAVIGALASSDPSDDLPALFSAIETFQATDFEARMGAVADAILRARPHVVGLQEVSVLDIDLTALGAPIVLHADFLPVLMSALRDRGLHYAVAASVLNIDASPGPGIRLVDYDVLLVDERRVTVQESGGRNYAVNLGVVAPGVELKRGWVWASVLVEGQPYTIASTHLEGSARHVPELMAAQASELAAFLPSGPVVVMGDFNDTPGSMMHGVMSSAGFTDVWSAMRPGVAGNTCCHPADLSNHVAQLDERIDYVFTRGIGEKDLKGSVKLIGEVPSDRIAGPAHRIWPSDHAGLAASLKTN